MFVNFEGVFLVMKYVSFMMCVVGWGFIVYMFLMVGIYGYFNCVFYVVVKWGIIGFMKIVVMELGLEGICVNVICPGVVEGFWMEGVLECEVVIKGMMWDDVYVGYVVGMLMWFFVMVEDIVNMVVFLGFDVVWLVLG